MWDSVRGGLTKLPHSGFSESLVFYSEERGEASSGQQLQGRRGDDDDDDRCFVPAGAFRVGTSTPCLCATASFALRLQKRKMCRLSGGGWPPFGSSIKCFSLFLPSSLDFLTSFEAV